MSELGFEENHAVQTMLSVSFVYVPLAGSPRLAFHYPEPLSEINSDGGMSDGSAGSLGDSSRVHSLPRAFFADFLCAKLQLCDAVMDITIDRLRFIGYPLLLPSSNPNSKPDRTVQHDIKSFNVVFTVNRSELLKNRGPLHMPTACSRASKVIGIALRYEEMRCGYLSEQVELLKTGSFSHNQASSSQCNLSMVLTETFESLRSSLITRVFVNGWLEVSLPPPYEPIEPSDREPIRPYQTMLPIDSDVSKLEALLPRGTSQVVRTLLREANPCKSFQDLEVEIDIPLETLLMAAGTLVEWHLGIISETISKHNVYVVSPTADIAVGSPLYFEFEKFSGNVRDRRWSLPGLLLQFSAPQTLEKHRTALGGSAVLVMEFIACLIWLIRIGLVIQLKTYIHLSLFDYSEQEQAGVLKEKYGSRSDFHRFLKLTKYFDGKHHVEDIMWRENCTREELFRIIDSYSDVLTTCVHEQSRRVHIMGHFGRRAVAS